MYLIKQALILLCALSLSDAGYGSSASNNNANEQSDVEAPAYIPPYLKNQQFSKTSYSGTKNGYTKSRYSGYTGTKTQRSGVKTGGTKNSGVKSRYAETKSWHSNNGAPPSYNQFQNNARLPFNPKCDPECKNNGICVNTNTCDCPPNFNGQFCEFEKKPCLSYPPQPMNSRRKCSPELCTVECMSGHKFLDGSTIANLRCVQGEWRPTRADITTLSDCVPECTPPCMNGGVCLGVNTCECPDEFRGPQCQYSADVCDVRKLSFNGAHYCAGDADVFSCTFSCPPGTTYSTPPAEVYTCLYATGVFEPQPIPHCIYPNTVLIPSAHRRNHTYTESERKGSHTKQSVASHSHHETFSSGPSYSQVLVVQDLTPKGGTCLTWAGIHYKTFDGNIYSVKSECQHVLVRNAKDHKYSVEVKHGDCKSMAHCPSELTIYLEEKFFVLAIGEDGSVLFRNSKRLIPIPASLPGIRVSMPSDHVLVNLDALGVTIKWDTNNVILVEGSVQLWNNTEGLCGTLDGNPNNEYKTKEGTLAKTKAAFASAWKINKIGDLCEGSPSETSACSTASEADMKKAQQFCNKIFSKDKFRKCSKVMDVSLLLETCQWDYCACATTTSPEDCACSTVSVYAKECLRHGVTDMKNWRDDQTCPMKCTENKIYKSCGPDSQPSCSFPLTSAKIDNSTCVEGCFCPEGLLLEEGRCVPKSECPCRLRNKSFKPGKTIRKDCNTCKCESGQWICTSLPCGARCSAVGDPHYSTFDGLRYDFMGHCTYTMLKTDNITVDVENVACSGAITEAMNLGAYKGEGKPSCTKAVTLSYEGATVHMKQGGFIMVNGKEVTTLPVMVGDVRIRAASSLFVIVQLPNKVDLWWDGNTRVFIDVPAEFHGKTQGLCGTFNLNQKDDFLTPEKDVEQSALAFANKWKTREFCSDIDTKEPEHPCKSNIENKEAAEKYCSKLKSKLFESCHWYVDVEPYYEACVYDMCACAGDVSRCLCPVLGDYAMTCAKAGVIIQWRYSVQECEIQCTGGQQYTVCADSCLRKCSDVSLAASGKCKPCCVEGCACPDGQLLDDNGQCVPNGLCPCYHKGMQFNAGYKEIRPGRRERELCTCVGARWDCKPATPDEIQNYPPAEDIRSNCSASNNMEFTTCQIAEPLTCKNMHLPPTSVTAECRPGCMCKKGYVLDTASKKCVTPANCPCHHGGRSYPDGEVMQEECNKCECKSGNWSCTDRKCAGLCTAWGDSHVVTFDGTDYDFEGVCSYLLAKGIMDSKDGFDVEIQNVPCGTTGATCSKSVTLKIGSGGNEEIVSLTKDAPVPDISKLERIKMRVAGSYVFLDVPSLGMSLQWDRGMRVYVKVDSSWRGRVKGLCGNYNSDRRDDFQTPSGGGIAESSALIFADSWKLKATCPKPERILDHCKQRPERKEWATNECSLMKRYPFTLCHAEVPPADYIERCTRDACACDVGGDCACVCTALAAYAHACAHRGVTFKWRTQETCPMQCDEECSNYDACLPACPLETCDNTLYYTDMKLNCEQDTCVEGCKPKKSCPPGQVYKNESHTECVPRAKCKPVCMTLEDGTEVEEGGIVEEDSCHTCRCSKKHKVCTGQPCSTIAPRVEPEPSTVKPHGDSPLTCMTGWTDWINRGPPEIGNNGESIDNEPLPKQNEMIIGKPMCKERMMKTIECRTVGDHKTYKETGLDVECSLQRGLVCKEVGKPCLDFEIRVYCDCEGSVCENSVRPNEPHPSDCTKFYECSPSDGSVLKQCGPGTMYNPDTMVCDWPASVALVRPECATTTTAPETTVTTEEPTTTSSEASTTKSRCPPGTEFNECAYPCQKTCDYFKKSLMKENRCIKESCVEGCVNSTCPEGQYWRDQHTCVPVKDCTCFSQGNVVKPGGVVVDGCIKCQCINNDLHCDSSECVIVSTPGYGTTHLPYILPKPVTSTTTTTTTTTTSTEAPTTEATTKVPTTEATTIMITVPECSPDDYVNLLWGDEPLPDSAFSASSVANELYKPQFAKLNGHPLDITAGSWNPKVKDQKQYIQVEFPNPEPIFGVIIQGSPLFSHYVTSYEVLYGDDKDHLIPVKDLDNEPEIFPGPSDNNTPQKQMIEPPITAKVIRIRPLTWHEEIAVRLEVIGCSNKTSTTEVPSTTTTEIITTTPTETISTTVTTPSTTTTSTTVTTPTTTTTTVQPTTPTTIAAPLIVTSTVSPPPECNPDSYMDLMWGDEPLPDSSFSASSSASALYEPQYAKLNGEPHDTSAGSWNPKVSDQNQYIQVEFPRREPIYGVKMQGNPVFDQYVTSYEVLYGDDGVAFSTVNGPDGKPKVFRGPVNQESPMKQMIEPPIDAKVVRIRPLTWHEEIAVRFELIGCQEPSETTTSESTTTSPTVFTIEALVCDEPLGLSSSLPVDMIEVSSNSDARQYFTLFADRGWRPLYSTPGEWIMFNFTSPRNITGIKTKGGPKGWVTTYKILYTSDLSTFNPVVDKNKADKIFAGNFDKDTTVMNEFHPPIHAQYFKVLPITWHDNIEMRIEPIGCYEPYPEITTTPSIPSTRGYRELRPCEYCPGVEETSGFCECSPPSKYYDGENCVTRDQCPCVESLMTYPVGSKFRGANCDECICKLGGITDCELVKECKCASDLVPKLLPSTCECICEPCTNGTKICPTSKLCLPLDKWCDGLQDCPDDEKECTTTSTTVTTPLTTVTEQTVVTKQISTVASPVTTVKRRPKYTKRLKSKRKGSKLQQIYGKANNAKKHIHERGNRLSDRYNNKKWMFKTAAKKVISNNRHYNFSKFMKHNRAVTCPKVECPPGYSVVYTRKPNKDSSTYSQSGSDLPPPRPHRSYQRFAKGGAKGYTKTGYTKNRRYTKGFSKNPYGLPQQSRPKQAFSLDKPEVKKVVSEPVQECPQFKCIPKLPPFRPGGGVTPPPACSVVTCPTGYTLKLDSAASMHTRCPQYECVPPPERPVFCNITGRTFNTFDGAEYKYDVCFHILARENRLDSWVILLRKKCRVDGCRNELLILQDDQLILIKPNMMIEYDNYEYTVEQTSKICFQKNSFDVGRLGNGISIKSRKYNFLVIYNPEGDIKIGVYNNYKGQVDGLCGAFDGNPRNDRRRPDGKVTTSIDEFGRSWAKPGLPPDACQTKVISDEKQKHAWELCDALTKEPLSECAKVLNLNKWRSICLEKICECTQLVVNGTHRSDKECRCLVVEQLVAECLAADKNIDVSSWRIQLDCPADCPPPLVHYDCYRKRCEPTCSTYTASTRSCPTQEGACYPGCYCPEGKLRRGDNCVLPSDCLDCNCNGVGTPAKYVTFEGDDLPFLGNCTYLASRDKNSTGQHKYEVYATNGPCEDNNAVVCTQTVHLVYEKNVIHITKDTETNKLVTSLGGKAIYKYPMKKDWVVINQVNGQDITITLPDKHVELTVLQSKMEFHVRVPSYLYANQTEGLCGVCAGYQDALITSNGTTTEDFDEYGKSWQASPDTLKTLDISEQAQCDETPATPECVLPPPETNPCYNLYNADRFGACHALVELDSYVSSCEADLCANATDACVSLERYAAACRRQGVCLQEWRNDLCPYQCEAPLVYRPCVDCERTCDNYYELRDKPDMCIEQPVEGCFCPEGKVRVNNTCIEPSKCFPCDVDSGHYVGDEWQEDACTKCVCSKSSDSNSAQTSCTKQFCAAPVCDDTEDMITTPAKPGHCCDGYTCVLKPVANCTEPKKMTCGFGQVLKQKKTADGCKEYACECMPASECEPLPSANEVEILEPGMNRLVDSSGCCPRVQFLCQVETCPQPPQCDKYYELKTDNKTGKCCPEFECVLPKDKCIVKLEWEAASKGGEKSRTTPQTVLKDLDTVWLDGPCRTCRCEATSLGAVARCTATECPSVVSTEDFVLEPRPVPFQCCPKPVYVACIHGDNIYKVGENWTSTENPCESYKCVEEGEKLEKVTTLKECTTDCQPGWKYFPASVDSGECCGKCEPVACVVDGREREIGEKWSSSDHCANYTCINLNGTLQVECSNETCPEVSVAVKKQFVLKQEKVQGKCCPIEEPVACRVGNLIYQEGQTWPSPDPCKNVSCTRDVSGHLSHQESVTSCVKDCKRGWTYQEPDKDKCCGECVHDKCVVDDQLYEPGTTWQSTDNCTTYSCERADEDVYVTSSREACPDVSRCAPQHLVNGTCCQLCDEPAEALSKCVPRATPSAQTVGVVRKHVGVHGLCVNKLPIAGLNNCEGSCDSGTTFNNMTATHDTLCECCQPLKYTALMVTLSCEDGTQHPHKVASPSECGCARCGGLALPSWKKPGYSGTKNSPTKGGHEEWNDFIPEIYRRMGKTERPTQTERPIR